MQQIIGPELEPDHIYLAGDAVVWSCRHNQTKPRRPHYMFPEYRELISQLKSSDVHFQKKFDLHNDLDVEIRKLEKHHASDYSSEVKDLKKQKLKLKEEIYDILKQHPQ